MTDAVAILRKHVQTVASAKRAISGTAKPRPAEADLIAAGLDELSDLLREMIARREARAAMAEDAS